MCRLTHAILALAAGANAWVFPKAAPGLALEDHWAVIVAGSNTYANYRHQADACHAYQIAKANGIPEDQIILFMYDDIASSSENPFPGQIFNAPSPEGTPGVDVYDGCKASYTGADVTAEKFLAVLTGDAATAGGPVLTSGARDNVFIYYTDHGGVGIIAMPGNEPVLSAADLNGALTTMKTNNMYKRLVFYLEACESGSMFQGGLLANDTMVYATTAASGAESSWGCYCSDEAMVDGKNINSCLGDLYSVSWMEDSDLGTSHETLDAQTAAVTIATNKSHVQKFGDQTFADDYITAFQGKDADKRGDVTVVSAASSKAAPRAGLVNAREATLAYLEAKILNAPTPAAKAAAIKEHAAELAARAATVQRFNAVALAHGTTLHSAWEKGSTLDVGTFTAAHWACYEASIEAVRTTCPNGVASEHVLAHLKVLASLCYADAAADVAGAVAKVCA